MSHVAALELPSFPRPLFITDTVVNISPTVDQKRDIVQNAIDLAHSLGMSLPKVAILAAREEVSSKLPSSFDAAVLCKMADRRQITGAVLDGPLGFDVAVSEGAAKMKCIQSPVAGCADILVVPDLEAGAILVKQLEYTSDAQVAGLVIGARVPIIATSRSGNTLERLASCALALLQARNQQADASSPKVLPL